MFFRREPSAAKASTSVGDFGFVPADQYYFDSACQTLKPSCVIEAETAHSIAHNACGGRVKYKWGQEVDSVVTAAREGLLELAGKSPHDYVVAFTLNTTYGLNLVLQQLPGTGFDRIATSITEHNSVFLPTLTWAERMGKARTVLTRRADGSLEYQASDLQNAVVVTQGVSNIDGRSTKNLPELARDVHAANGVLLVDAAQSFAHDVTTLQTTDFDAAFGSGHKMYGPSIGFIIIKRSLLARLQPFFIGGGTVDDVRPGDYTLMTKPEDAHSILEPGLQNWGGIAGLKAAMDWLKTQGVARAEEARMSELLFANLKTMPRVHLINTAASPIVSFWVEGLDSHRLAVYFDQQHIMCRSGHFCCHAYLQHTLKVPPLVRVSLGLYNTSAQVEHVCRTLQTILTTL